MASAASLTAMFSVSGFSGSETNLFSVTGSSASETSSIALRLASSHHGVGVGYLDRVKFPLGEAGACLGDEDRAVDHEV